YQTLFILFYRNYVSNCSLKIRVAMTIQVLPISELIKLILLILLLLLLLLLPPSMINLSYYVKAIRFSL
ncbi:MAG: hypothetical protein K7J15_04850, partial [Candidatus Regiella insecticola]|nr:hypothetical protein [Candidatus Regiella insecticola]